MLGIKKLFTQRNYSFIEYSFIEIVIIIFTVHLRLVNDIHFGPQEKVSELSSS